MVEVVLEGAIVPPQVLDVFVDAGLSVCSDGSGTQECLVHSVVVAHA